MLYNWIVEDKISLNLIYSTCLYLNKQRRYDISKCVLNSKFSHFTQNQNGSSFIISSYLSIELSLFKIDCSLDSFPHIDV